MHRRNNFSIGSILGLFPTSSPREGDGQQESWVNSRLATQARRTHYRFALVGRARQRGVTGQAKTLQVNTLTGILSLLGKA